MASGRPTSRSERNDHTPAAWAAPAWRMHRSLRVREGLPDSSSWRSWATDRYLCTAAARTSPPPPSYRRAAGTRPAALGKDRVGWAKARLYCVSSHSRGRDARRVRKQEPAVDSSAVMSLLTSISLRLRGSRSTRGLSGSHLVGGACVARRHGLYLCRKWGLRLSTSFRRRSFASIGRAVGCASTSWRQSASGGGGRSSGCANLRTSLAGWWAPACCGNHRGSQVDSWRQDACFARRSTGSLVPASSHARGIERSSTAGRRGRLWRHS